MSWPFPPSQLASQIPPRSCKDYGWRRERGRSWRIASGSDGEEGTLWIHLIEDLLLSNSPPIWKDFQVGIITDSIRRNMQTLTLVLVWNTLFSIEKHKFPPQKMNWNKFPTENEQWSIPPDKLNCKFCNLFYTLSWRWYKKSRQNCWQFFCALIE